MSDNNIQQGGIYKLPFPFTDLTNKKYRPALAITSPDAAGDARFVFITTMPLVAPAQRIVLGMGDFYVSCLPFNRTVRPAV